MKTKRDGCTGKKRHGQKWGAEIHIKKLREPGMKAYRCHQCGFWHIGHRHPEDGFQSRLNRLIGPDPRTQAQP